jgi:hypothetical protein
MNRADHLRIFSYFTFINALGKWFVNIFILDSVKLFYSYTNFELTYLCYLYQTAKTKVINSCLNPVWNEELSFSLSEPVGVLNLVSSLSSEFRNVQFCEWVLYLVLFHDLLNYMRSLGRTFCNLMGFQNLHSFIFSVWPLSTCKLVEWHIPIRF